MNIEEGVALCPSCGELTRLSELLQDQRPIHDILIAPPSGCCIEHNGSGATIRVSTRSWYGFLLPLAFALFWNAIVSMFLITAAAGIYSNFVGPLPDWIPGQFVDEGKIGEHMDKGMAVFLCVFLIPFVVAGLFMIGLALMGLLGKIEVVLQETGSWVGAGVGFIQWRRRFDAKQVRSVSLIPVTREPTVGNNQRLELVANRTVRFASTIPEQRQEWLKAVLQCLLCKKSTKFTSNLLPHSHWLPRQRD